MEVKLFRTNSLSVINQCYLVEENHFGILIDPSWDYPLISRYLNDRDIELKAVFLTHSHPDHTDLAAKFATDYRVPVLMSGEEVAYYGFECPNLSLCRHLEIIQLPPFNITPILTPGHTAGSTCFLVGNNLFTGDTIFIEGVGICNVEGSDVHQMYDSVQFLKAKLPLSTKIWPGHSFGYPAGKDLQFLLENNIYFQLDDPSVFTAFRMRKNQPSPYDFK